MTLKEFVEKYDGTMCFSVSRLIPGGVEDIVDFCNDECEAIKDEILQSTVSKYSVDTSTTTRVTSIKVMLETAADSGSGDAEQEQEPDSEATEEP